MSYADELRKKTEKYDPKQMRKEIVESRISRSIKAIKYSCENATREGKNSVDGVVCFSVDFFDWIIGCEKKDFSRGTLFEDLTKDEERQVIESIRNEMELLGFDNCMINSYHPGRVINGTKKVGMALFRPQRRVPTYRKSDGFYIEVHIKW